MIIEDYGLNISRFEELLQKITSNITSGIIFEKLTPSELWEKSEADVMSLQSLAEQLKELMLVLKPERAPTIERRTKALLQPLNDFREMLFRRSDDLLANSKLALEELRKAVMEGSNFLDLAKEIKGNPSESIAEVLKLKEVYDTKEYLSAIPVPEAAYVRFVGLRRNMENLKLSISSIERILGELRKNLDHVAEEISKFRPLSIEKSKEEPKKSEDTSKEKTVSEPTLLSEDKE